MLQTSLFKTSLETPYRLHWAEENLAHGEARQETQGGQEEKAWPEVRAASWKHSEPNWSPVDVQVAGADGSKETRVVRCDLPVAQNTVESRTGCPGGWGVGWGTFTIGLETTYKLTSSVIPAI